jgi:hypothetical protein
MSENIDIAEYEQRVRNRAYDIWESEGRPNGRHVEHWMQSEAAESAEPLVALAEAAVAAPEAAPATLATIEMPKAAVAAPKKPAAKAKAPRTNKKPIAASKHSTPVHELSAGL